MVTSLYPNTVSSQSTRKSGRTLAPEFRLLGLRPREARLDVIRGALKDTASDLKGADEFNSQDSLRVARVAVAGYRLLDPRRRGTLFERVQLLLWTEEDLVAAPSTALWDVVDEGDVVDEDAQKADESPMPTRGSLRVVATPVGSPLPPPVVGEQSVKSVRLSAEVTHAEETQVALDLFRTIRKRDRRAMALWVSVTALAMSLGLTLSLAAALI